MAGVDSDRDTVPDRSDACPKQARGRFDFNKNGCPGPYKQIKPKVTWGKIEINVEGAGIVTISALGVSKLPVGGSVTLQSGDTVIEKLKVPKSGAVRLTRIAGVDFRDGATFRVRIVQPGWIGYEGTMEVSDTSRPVPLRVLCIPATGPQAATACGRVDRGK